MIALHFEEAKQNLEDEEHTNLCYSVRLNLTHFLSLTLRGKWGVRILVGYSSSARCTGDVSVRFKLYDMWPQIIEWNCWNKGNKQNLESCNWLIGKYTNVEIKLVLKR